MREVRRPEQNTSLTHKILTHTQHVLAVCVLLFVLRDGMIDKMMTSAR